MTVLVEDRIEMAEQHDELGSDDLFELVERSTPEGYRAEIVEGTIVMTPQRDVHWHIIRRVVRALEDHFGMDVLVLSDVRIDFPGELNYFCPDVTKLRDDAQKGSDGTWHYRDIEFIAEVISRGTGFNDYGPKKAAYATAGVPLYLIADPYQRKCHAYTNPKGTDYKTELIVSFGTDVDLTKTPLGLTLKTDEFPTD